MLIFAGELWIRSLFEGRFSFVLPTLTVLMYSSSCGWIATGVNLPDRGVSSSLEVFFSQERPTNITRRPLPSCTCSEEEDIILSKGMETGNIENGIPFNFGGVSNSRVVEVEVASSGLRCSLLILIFTSERTPTSRGADVAVVVAVLVYKSADTPCVRSHIRFFANPPTLLAQREEQNLPEP